MERRANALYDRLAGEQEDGLTYKPKRMRWRTFNRIMARANELAEASDLLGSIRIMRLLKMLPPALQ